MDNIIMASVEFAQVDKKNLFLEGLNYDCLVYIFKYLSIHDLNACSQVSSHFRLITDSFRAKGVLKSRDNNIKQLNPEFRSIFLRSLIVNVGHHLYTIYLDFDYIKERHPKRTMHIIQDNCIGTLRQLSLKRWAEMELDEFPDLLLGLELLHLKQCSGPGAETPAGKRFGSVLRALSKLKTISMVECTNCLADDEMPSILENKQQMHIFQLVTPSAHGFQHLASTLSKLPSLQHVALHMESTKLLDLTPLADIQDLRSLQLTNYTGMSLDMFATFCYMFRDLFNGLGRRGRLEELVLHHCRMDDVTYTSIATIASLRHLALRKHYWANDRSIRRIAAQGKIRSIDLFDCGGITKTGVVGLVAANPTLAIVDVSWCSQMNNEVVADVYEVLRNRPRSPGSGPFDLFLGGSNRVDQRTLPPIDPNVLKIWFDSEMKIDLRATHTVNMMLSEVEQRVRNTMLFRIRTLTVESLSNALQKDHRDKGTTTATAELVAAAI